MATDVVTPPPSKPSPEAPSATTTTPTVDPPPSTTPVTITPRPQEPEADVIHIPSYSRWFSWNGIHECEARFVPEFFDGRSTSKNPRVYKYYRNAIIKRFRENPTRKITFTEVRKTIVGDVGSIRRVFDFLEAWGLINYTGGSTAKQPQLKWEDKETKTAAAAQGGDSTDVTVPKKRFCSGCKAPCSIACFASEKHDMTLCARCYVRGNYRVGLNSTDFKRVVISEEAKTDWTDKETLQLLEAIMHYGDDWKKVSEHVGGRSVKECVARFIKLPFGEQFDGPPESTELDVELGVKNAANPTKKARLSPLADASNPIMTQAAFLSTLVGVDVAEVAARAAVTALSDLGNGKHQESSKAPPSITKQQESDNASDVNNLDSTEEALVKAKLQLEKEEDELEKAISGITDEANEIEDKIVHFEEFDLQMERKLQQLQQLQNLLYFDQLTLLFHKTAAPKTVENAGEAMKSE
ncbi:hypothetical protein ACJIZ3_003317 [Penstemon smallii]|uniref:SWI/SNF complex subunit SWI3B n=1 Tax=Penstemon smallii TaxID=265156 RepID=A0ABD3U8W7_9LAMI